MAGSGRRSPEGHAPEGSCADAEILRLLPRREGVRRHTGWQPQWRTPEPKPAYDVVIIGGGGHGLATAYYLAKEHGIRNVAVIERAGSAAATPPQHHHRPLQLPLHRERRLYDHAVKLWEGLSKDLNYNTMYSPRGVMMLAHTVHDVQSFKRHIHANR